MVKGRSPTETAVGAFEDSSGDRAEIISIGIARNSGDGQHTATAKRPDLPPLHAADKGWVDLCRRVHSNR